LSEFDYFKADLLNNGPMESRSALRK
jgi:hypothetical protein